MYNLITLDQIKAWLKAEQTSGEDDFFLSLQDAVSGAIEDYTDRKFITRQYTDFYDNSDSTKSHLLLDNYPLYNDGSNFSFWMDTNRDFTSSTLVDTDDYSLETPISMIILHESYLYTGNRVLKVQYYAGNSRFNVVTDANDYLDIDSANIQITAGKYIAETLATQLQTQLNAEGLTGTYSVTYNHARQKFEITNDTTSFTLKWKTGDNRLKSIASLIGYDSGQDKSGAQSYEADIAVTGLPRAITLAAQKLIHNYYSDSKRADNKQVIIQKDVGGDVTLRFDKNSLPPDVVQLLTPYVRFS